MTSGAKNRLVVGLSAAVAAGVLALVQPWEGRELKAYADPIGIPTICDGVTKGVKLGDVATHEQCDQRLVDELLRHDRDMRACLRVQLTPNQHAAFLSFTYNVGASDFCSSTAARKLNAGDAAGACAELSKWVCAGREKGVDRTGVCTRGHPLRGLIKRRAAERAVCETPSTP